jgi:3,4-dihydroxy-9,10-secoandrosta-1,3,5(10)-triene-9,17-dione 4,5-dioxygenase
MSAVQELRYIVLGARDLDAWERFATQGLGLGTSGREDDVLYLRCDRWVARVIIVRSDQEDVLALGWGVAEEADLDRFAAKLDSHKIAWRDVRGPEARARRALRLIRLQDGNGITHEIAWGCEANDRTPFRSPIAVDGFRTDELGLGHIVLSIDDLEASARFFRDILGHKVSSHLFVHGFEAIFLRCNPRHHTVALSVSHRPKRLQHLQIEYNSFDDLGRALDRAEELPMPVVATLGKHVSDWVTSFYVRAPSEVTIEIAYGARIMADDAPTEFENFTGSIWGHRQGMENA